MIPSGENKVIDLIDFIKCDYSSEFLKIVLLSLAVIPSPLQGLSIGIQGEVSDEIYDLISKNTTLQYLIFDQTNVDIRVAATLGRDLIQAFQRNLSIVDFQYPEGMISEEVRDEIAILLMYNRAKIDNPRFRSYDVSEPEERELRTRFYYYLRRDPERITMFNPEEHEEEREEEWHPEIPR